jgi:hypothetical protein
VFTRDALGRPASERELRAVFKGRVEFLAFCRYIRSLHPPEVRLHLVLDNFSPHVGQQMRDWAADNNVELAYTPFYRLRAEPHRSAVPGAEVLHARRRRPP